MRVLDRARSLGIDGGPLDKSVPRYEWHTDIKKAIRIEGARAFESGNFGRAETLAVLYRHVCEWGYTRNSNVRTRWVVPYTARDSSMRYMEMYSHDGDDVVDEVAEVFKRMQAIEDEIG